MILLLLPWLVYGAAIYFAGVFAERRRWLRVFAVFREYDPESAAALFRVLCDEEERLRDELSKLMSKRGGHR
jgi:predicted exporter